MVTPGGCEPTPGMAPGRTWAVACSTPTHPSSTAKKATTINENIVFFIFPPFVGSPSRDLFYGIATNSLLRTSLHKAHVRAAQRKKRAPECAIRELKSGYTILSESNSVGTRRE